MCTHAMLLNSVMNVSIVTMLDSVAYRVKFQYVFSTGHTPNWPLSWHSRDTNEK